MPPTFHQRPLPEALATLSSDEGRKIFREALAEGYAEGFFALAEQFHTQADPAFCGLGSLVVVLNALGIDPGRLWKGPWRWFSEELLDCCVPLEEIREKGLTITELACLARCNGAEVRVERALASEVDAFRADVVLATKSPRGPVLVASYARGVLGQTGSGHFSPIGAYNPERDLVLLLDVARFKYPPHWVPLPRLFEAMSTIDDASQQSRGWLVFDAATASRALYFALAPETHVSDLFARTRDRLRGTLASARDVPGAFARFAEVARAAAEALERRPVREAAAEEVSGLEVALRSSELHAALAAHGGEDVERLAFLALALPDSTWEALPEELRAPTRALLAKARGHAGLASDAQVLGAQLGALARLADCRARACAPP